MNRHAPLGSAITGLGPVLVFASCAVASDARLGPIPDGLQLSPRVHHYSVAGSTADELRGEMVRLGPKEGDRSFPGYTKWNVRWQFGYESLADRCALTGVTVFSTSPRPSRAGGARPMLRPHSLANGNVLSQGCVRTKMGTDALRSMRLARC